MRERILVLATAAIVATVSGVAAQSPSPSTSPGALDAPCGIATELRFPIHDPGAQLVAPFAAQDAATGGFLPAETWTLPDAPEHRAVYAAGPGQVLAAGTIGVGDRGGIVVVEHTGPYLVPASLPGDPYLHDATPTDTLLTVHAGIDPVAVTVGDCVDADSLIGLTTAQCADGVAQPCSTLPAGLRFEIRIGSTADPALRSEDWSVVGTPDDSADGVFFDPQVMVDAGIRDPSRVLTALAPPCPDASADPGASPGASTAPCGPVVPVASPSAAPEPTASPEPTPRPVVSARTALRQGIPQGLRADCRPRTSRLITGTLAAVDCRPEGGAIELITYFLGRPADVRFTINSRIREEGLQPGGDCPASREGVQSRTPAAARACYRDSQGRANLRETIAASCPGVYIGVLGRGSDIGALADAWERLTGGTSWTPAGTVEPCANDTGEVSAPPMPTDVHYTFRPRKPTAQDPAPPTRVTITWSIPVTADTVIEIYGIDGCLTKPPKNGSVPCISTKTRIPPQKLVLLKTVPADAFSSSWLVPPIEILGGASYYDEEHGSLDSLVVRARNARGASRFAIIPEARGEACDGCVY